MKQEKSIHLIIQGIEGGGRSGHLGSVVFDKFLVSFERFTFIHFRRFLKILCVGGIRFLIEGFSGRNLITAAILGHGNPISGKSPISVPSGAQNCA